MMLCPAGHESSTSDYCSICGTPMAAASPPVSAQTGAPVEPAGPAPTSTPAPRTQTCPVCSSVAGPDAFFCETCGYDFLTGSMPRSATPAEPEVASPGEPSPTSPDEQESPEPAPIGSARPAPADAGDGAIDERDDDPSDQDYYGASPDRPEVTEPEPEPAAPPVTTFSLDDVPGHGPLGENPLVVEAQPGSEPVAPASNPVLADALSLGAPEGDVPSPDDLEPLDLPPRQPSPPTVQPQQPGRPGGCYPPTRQGPPARVPSQAPRPRATGPAAPAGPPANPVRRPPQPARAPQPGPEHAAQPSLRPQQPAARPRPAVQMPSETGPARWVAEIWIDPEWYRVQQAPEQLPSPGQPIIRALRKQAIVIGRATSSGRPDLDSVTDTGVSRRQAALTTDGSRWFIEDLGSSNGTYIGQVDQPMPTTPISGRVELSPQDRIYIGSWTRIVVRPALVQEADL